MATVDAAAQNLECPIVLFYLGTHQTAWLKHSSVPLFISRRRLAGYKKLPKAKGIWALDSGGFTELSMHGKWTVSPERYAEDVQRFDEGIGGMLWAAPQDWMCEPWIIEKTGLSVDEHQARTVENFLLLRDLIPTVNIVPVLQGYSIAEYLKCFRMYEEAGIDLRAESRVAIGSVCRRQRSDDVNFIIETLAGEGLSLHAFGYKLTGLPKVAHLLASSDSMAWSYAARRQAPLPGCVGHINCANCYRYAYQWYGRVQRLIAESTP